MLHYCLVIASPLLRDCFVIASALPRHGAARRVAARPGWSLAGRGLAQGPWCGLSTGVGCLRCVCVWFMPLAITQGLAGSAVFKFPGRFVVFKVPFYAESRLGILWFLQVPWFPGNPRVFWGTFGHPRIFWGTFGYIHSTRQCGFCQVFWIPRNRINL